MQTCASVSLQVAGDEQAVFVSFSYTCTLLQAIGLFYFTGVAIGKELILQASRLYPPHG